MLLEDIFEDIIDYTLGPINSDVDYYRYYCYLLMMIKDIKVINRELCIALVYHLSYYIMNDEDYALDVVSAFCKKYKNKKINIKL